MNEILEKMPIALKRIKEKKPLTHCITNYVTVNDCVNAILAIGATPIMAEDLRELESIVNISSGLVINIGTINENQEKSILKACKIANETNTPITFDPVGVGISSLRNEITLNIINNYKLAAIRGNMSEIKAIGSLIFDEKSSSGIGVDVKIEDITTKENLKVNGEIVKKIAKELKTVVIASGAIDLISDGEIIIVCENGDELMPQITGSGCMLSAITGSCVSINDSLEGSVLACLLMTLSGEYAKFFISKLALGTGTFRSILIDYLSKINSEDIKLKSKIYKL